MNQNPLQEGRAAEKGKHKNTCKEHNQQEIRTAAGMHPALSGHVFHCQLFARFIAVDAHVFCTMVGKYPFDIVHPRNGRNVEDKNGCLNGALHEVEQNIGGNMALHEAEQKGR